MMWYTRIYAEESLQMQTDISHLPEAKQRELERITEILRAQGEVAMVILFGSYARGDWREEKDPALLVVVSFPLLNVSHEIDR